MSPSSHAFQLYRVGGDAGVWWRLIASNGRSLGRASVPLTDAAAAQQAIADIVEALPRAVCAIHVDADFRWRWSLELGGVPVVASAVHHDRRTRCLQAARRFVDIAPVTPVESVVLTFPAVVVRLGSVQAPRVAGAFVPRSSFRSPAVAVDGFDRRVTTGREGR
ncbi:MAG: hypothetical protein FWF90_06130 [Promicromonosporaceae bacterium]|nr:hypothetical protein [Promicromonosporaceae bacterium]